MELGDFPVTQKSGQFSYQLAVVVDDLNAAINQVVRGNDLVASTFRQLQIYEALGAAAPQYAHVPLVRGLDGNRLAKRHGDTRLSEYRAAGVSQEQIVGWAAFSVGLKTDANPCSADEMISAFEFAAIHDADTLIDPSRLYDH